MDFEPKQPDEIFQNFKDKIPPNFSFLRSGGSILILIVLFILLRSAIYTIQQDEQGVVLRFGKMVRIDSPGLHLKLPLGIEKVFPVQVTRKHKEEFGFRTRSAGVKTVYDTAKAYDEESLMLTGELNVMDIEWIVQFQINDPFKALFKVRNLRKTLRDISESVMRKVIGDFTFDEVLDHRTAINDQVSQNMQEILNFYDVGVRITNVKLQDVNPPNPVKPAFNEVNEAKQEKEKMINQAWKEYNQKIPQARGEAEKMVKEAEGYATEKINRAEGDAARFTLLLKEYSQAKDVTRQRLYLETMQEVLTRADKKYIVDSDQKGILPLLKLNDEK